MRLHSIYKMNARFVRECEGEGAVARVFQGLYIYIYSIYREKRAINEQKIKKGRSEIEVDRGVGGGCLKII